MRSGFIVLTAALGIGSGWAAPALANDWGCEVLLCLSNPGGATQYAQCVPPITKLWERLALGGSSPACTGAGVVDTRVHNRNSPVDRSVTMTFSDGHQQSYSLAEARPEPGQ